MNHTDHSENENSKNFELHQSHYAQKFGIPDIKIFDEGTFSICIQTKNLHIKSIQKEDTLPLHAQLWGQPNVMRLFANGTTKTFEQTKARVDTWVQRWKNKIPFAAMIIRSRQSNDFVGYIVMGFGSEPNSSEVAYMICEDKWNRGFGYESVGALTLFLSRKLMENNFKVNKNDEFKRIIATASIENVASCKILQKCGFKVYKDSEKYGAKRHEYELWLN